MRVRIGTLVIAAALVCGLMASMAGAEDGLLSTTSQSERTVTTTLYELTVHKSGRTDVTLRSGLKVFERAHPMMWLDGDKRPKPFDLDSRLSTREQVADRLGPGQGLLLRKKGCDWSLRTHTVQPFMTVQVSYTNPKKKPVRVKMLMPWCVGDFRGAGVTLGPGTADTRILENGRSVSGGSEWPDVTTNDTLSDWYMAAYNEDTGQTLLAGFLTHGSALTQVRMLHDEDREADKFPRFRAECVYDPPVELAPGETLVSEVFYVAVAERSPNTALERYGHAIAIANGIPVDHGVAPHGPTAQAGTAPPSEEGLRTSLDAMDTNLKRYGWTHFTIPAGWDAARGECLPDPARFPNGLKPLIDDIHSRGMTAGLALDPFVVSTGSQIAEQHPEWFVTPNDAGR
ncbi:MAG: hypothetical protein GY851_32660, partial [bacterium]|nr:hypothetical protein [bacterium]